MSLFKHFVVPWSNTPHPSCAVSDPQYRLASREKNAPSQRFSDSPRPEPSQVKNDSTKRFAGRNSRYMARSLTAPIWETSCGPTEAARRRKADGGGGAVCMLGDLVCCSSNSASIKVKPPQLRVGGMWLDLGAAGPQPATALTRLSPPHTKQVLDLETVTIKMFVYSSIYSCIYSFIYFVSLFLQIRPTPHTGF